MLLVGTKTSLPSTWTPMKQTDQFIAVPVPQQSAEYNKVQQQFAATAQNAYSTIIKVN